MIIDRLSTNEVSFIDYAGSGLIAKVKVTAWCVLTYTQVFSRGSSVITALLGHYLLLVHEQMVLLVILLIFIKDFHNCIGMVLPRIQVPPLRGCTGTRFTCFLEVHVTLWSGRTSFFSSFSTNLATNFLSAQ